MDYNVSVSYLINKAASLIWILGVNSMASGAREFPHQTNRQHHSLLKDNMQRSKITKHAMHRRNLSQHKKKQNEELSAIQNYYPDSYYYDDNYKFYDDLYYYDNLDFQDNYNFKDDYYNTLIPILIPNQY